MRVTVRAVLELAVVVVSVVVASACAAPVRDRPSLYAGVDVPPCSPRVVDVPVIGKAINANVFSPATDGLTDNERVVVAFEALEELGVDSIRVDFSWRFIEQQPDAFSWDVIDDIVAAAHARNITVLAILGYAPDWAAAGSGAGRAPREVADWVDFVNEAVTRYGTGGVMAEATGRPVTLWEIWNEANLDAFFAPGANAFDYAVLLATASATIRAHDDAAVVVASGLSVSDDPALSFRGFLGTLYDENVMDCVDVINVHPYLFGPELPEVLSARYLDDVRAFVDEHEETVPPLWLTEFGYIVPDWIDEDREADAVVDLLQRRGRDFDAVFWFSLFDLSITDRYGLIDTAGRRRPAFSAFAAAE